MTINVHSYESMGTFDGPGLRLVVFLQGCNFRCLYCANPDTIAGKGGTPTPPEEIVRMAMSQRPFFGKRGGVTFSGGEPTFQAKALVPLMRELKEKGIHVCIDSNGGIWNEEVEELFKLTDLVLQAGSEPFHVPVMVGQSVLADTVFHCLSHERVAEYFATQYGTDMFHLIIPHGLYILQILLNLRNPELRVVVTYCLFQPCPVECGNLFSEHCFGRHISVGMACHDEIVFTFMPSAFTFL